jgi:hypothetical protein
LNTPAFESIHQFAGGVKTLAHQDRLLAHGDEGILEETGLVLRRRGRRHFGSLTLSSVVGKVLDWLAQGEGKNKVPITGESCATLKARTIEAEVLQAE